MLEPGSEVSLDRLIDGDTGIEAEVAFWLDKDLPGPTVTREDVIGATAEVAAAIEIIKPLTVAVNDDPVLEGRIVMTTGEHPGDGKPKLVVFPNPVEAREM